MINRKQNNALHDNIILDVIIYDAKYNEKSGNNNKKCRKTLDSLYTSCSVASLIQWDDAERDYCT